MIGMRRSFLLLTLLLATFAQAATDSPATKRTDPAEPSDGRYALVEVQRTGKSTLHDLQLGGFDIQEAEPGQPIRVIANDAERERLTSAGFQYTELTPNLTEYYVQRSLAEGVDLIAGYPTFAETIDSMVTYHRQFPTLVSDTIRIGTTGQNRGIFAIKISDNVNVDEDEPEVFYNSQIHSREMITHTQLMYFIRYLLSNYATNTRVQNIVNDRELFFVLCVNPDGVVRNETQSPNGGGMWRKNRRTNPDNSRGVDLNRNFGFHWGYDDVGSSPIGQSETYRGTAAFSEPETQAIRDFCNQRSFRITINYHSYSNLIVHPTAYRREWAPDHELLRNLGNRWSVTNNFTVGNPWWLLYPVNGDCPDWQYDASPDSLPNFAYVIEIGSGSDGFWPQQSRILPLCQLMLETNLLTAEFAAEPRVVLPPPPPVFTVADTIFVDDSLRWQIELPDPANPAVSYDVRATEEYPVGTESFETGTGNWISSGSTRAVTHAASGTYGIEFANFADSKSFLILRNPVKLGANDTLKYRLRYDIETDFDYFFAQISTDEGITWYSLQGNRTVSTNPNANNWDYGITGSSNDQFVLCTHPLAQYANATVWFRFLFELDGGTQGDGVWLDDVTPSPTMILPWTWSESRVVEPMTMLPMGHWLVQVRARDAEGDTSVWSPLRWVTVVADDATEPTTTLPSQFGLRETYPNPFNSQMTIKYSLATAGIMSLQLYDVTGRLVSTLASGKQIAGAHELHWNGSNHASGVYWLRLSSGSQTATRKVALVK